MSPTRRVVWVVSGMSFISLVSWSVAHDALLQTLILDSMIILLFLISIPPSCLFSHSRNFFSSYPSPPTYIINSSGRPHAHVPASFLLYVSYRIDRRPVVVAPFFFFSFSFLFIRGFSHMNCSFYAHRAVSACMPRCLFGCPADIELAFATMN